MEVNLEEKTITLTYKEYNKLKNETPEQKKAASLKQMSEYFIKGYNMGYDEGYGIGIDKRVQERFEAGYDIGLRQARQTITDLIQED